MGMTSPDPHRDLTGKPVSESGTTIPKGLLKDAGPEGRSISKQALQTSDARIEHYLISGYDMEKTDIDYALEFLLAFDGRIHVFEDGCWTKFEIKRVEASPVRPHGVAYSFTLHAPDGGRLLGYDNAHAAPSRRTKVKQRPAEYDHWHRTEDDPGRPYAFKDVETLLTDFEQEVDRVLAERKVSRAVVATKEEKS